MAKYYLLEKDGKAYKTQSKFLYSVCIKLKDYKRNGMVYYSCANNLPFKLTKDERTKYKVALRLLR